MFDRSLYRELLFLTLAAMGKDHVGRSPLTSDLLQMLLWFRSSLNVPFFSFPAAAFDKKYKAAYSRLGTTLGWEELRRKRAQPPGAKAVDCRRSFHPPLQC